VTTPAAAPPRPPKILRESAIIPILMIGAGGYLLWFGVKYWRGAGAATWPSYPVKSVLQGKGVPVNTPAPSAEAALASYETAAQSGGGSTGSGTVAGYVNPFAKVQGLSPERVDQGVDFGGSGDVTAIGPAVVTFAGSGADTGWGPPAGSAPGGFIRYRLTGGPGAGKEVYVAEGVEPSVTVGQKLTAGQVIGRMVGGIETGWAGPAGTEALSSTPAGGSIGGSGPFPTKLGLNFDQLLVALGVPAAPNLGQPGSGDIPSGYPSSWGGPGDTSSGRPQNTARLLLSQHGWGPDQMPPLIALWTRESGWSPQARNPTSGALGIAQALGHGGQDTAGTLGNEYGAQYGLTADQAKAANSGNALQQIRWGLGYIKDRYGSPAAAEAHETSIGWY
jgi:hypothetical protein